MWKSRLDVIQLSKKRWILHADLIYVSDKLDREIVVPAEFITDLASVPRLPFAYMLTGDRARGPAVIHDWLYQHPDWDDRELADAVFYEAMCIHQPELGFESESSFIANLMWSGVRAGGWKAWRDYGKRNTELNPEWTITQTWPQAV